MQPPRVYQSELQAIPNGKPGVRVTLQLMRKLVDGGKMSSPVRLTTLHLISDLPQKDRYAEVQRIFDFVKNGIRYVYDINGVETLHYPETLLQLRQGDCDDKSILLASLLESIGYRTRFKAVAANSQKLNHVYTEVFVNGKWWALDTTENVNPGWEPTNITDTITVENLGGFSFSSFVDKVTGGSDGFIQKITGTSFIDKVTGINIYTDTALGVDPLMLWEEYQDEIKKYHKIIGPIAAAFIPYVGVFISAAMIAAQQIYDQKKALEAAEKRKELELQKAAELQAKVDSGELTAVTNAYGQTVFVDTGYITPQTSIGTSKPQTTEEIKQAEKKALGTGTFLAATLIAASVLIG